MSINPLLEHNTLPPFDSLKAEHVESAISELLEHNQQEMERLIDATRDDTRWDNFAAPLEALGDRLSQAWSPVSHLNSTMNSPELREAYQACLAKLSAYSTWVGQNSDLAAAYQRLADSSEFSTLDEAQQKAITNSLRDFRLAGVDLPDDKKQRYGEIQARLSELSNTFSNHVLDATQAWHKDVEEEALTGVPESGLAALKANAEAKGLEGYRITLDFPSFFPVLSYADNRELREEVYTAFVTRASDKGPQSGDYDNGPVIEEILALRQELAGLIGFDDYASLSLATKMADSPAQVIAFLDDLATRAVPQAREEFNELAAYATESLGIDDLQPWDVGFASEKLRESRYAINQEQLRPYFPAPQASMACLKWSIASTALHSSSATYRYGTQT